MPATQQQLEPHEAIKSMKLYHGLERIERRLRAEMGSDHDLKAGSNQVLDPEVLARVDSLHFLDDEPIRRILALLSHDGGQLVLDVGTGYGNTARLLAHRSSCSIHALELQPDMFAVGQELTRRCGLDVGVTHVLGNFLDPPKVLLDTQYDAVVGILSFLHIGSWGQLFTRCFESLRPGGFLFVEDFYLRSSELPKEDAKILSDDIFCSSLLSESELREVLGKSGFNRVEITDMTPQWTPYVVNRAENFHKKLDMHIERDGEQVANGLDHFYSSVATIFQRGNTGGYTLVAWKE